MIEAGAGGDVIAVVAMLMPMNGTPSRAERRGHVRGGRAGEGLATKGLFKMGALMKSSLRMGLLTKGVLKMGEGLAQHGHADDVLAQNGRADEGLVEDGRADEGLAQSTTAQKAGQAAMAWRIAIVLLGVMISVGYRELRGPKNKNKILM